MTLQYSQLLKFADQEQLRETRPVFSRELRQMMGVCCRQPVQANISGEKFQYNPLPFRQKTAEHPSGYFFAPVGFDTMAAAQARRVSALTCVLVCIFAAVGGVREQAAGVSGQDGRHHQVGAQGDQVLQTRRSERRKVHSEGACVIMDEVAPTDMVLHMNRPPPPLCSVTTPSRHFHGSSLSLVRGVCFLHFRNLSFSPVLWYKVHSQHLL